MPSKAEHQQFPYKVYNGGPLPLRLEHEEVAASHEVVGRLDLGAVYRAKPTLPYQVYLPSRLKVGPHMLMVERVS